MSGQQTQSRSWVKLWTDLTADPTIMGWSPTRRWCWVGGLTIAAQGRPEGSFTTSSGDPLSITDLSDRLNVDWHTARDFIEAALAAGKLVRDSSSDVVSVAKWNKRQGSPVGLAVARSLEGVGRSPGQSRGIVGLAPDPHIDDRARASEADSDAELTENYPSAGTSYAGPRGGRLPIPLYRLEERTRSLRGADQRTPRAVASVLEGLSEFDFDKALERTTRANARNEAAYLVATLKALKSDRPRAA